MADQKINELPTKTAPSTGDKMLMIGAAEEYQIDYDKLASAILDKLATKQYSSLDTTAKTVLGALDELNSKSYLLRGGIEIPSNSDMDNYKTPGNYFAASNNVANTLSNAPFTRAFTMKVEYSQGTGYPCQTFREYDSGNMAFRLYDTGAGSPHWTQYYYFSDDATLMNTLTAYAPTAPEDNDDISDLNVFTVSTRRFGRLVSIQFNIRGTIKTANKFITLFTLNEGYRPISTVIHNYINQGGVPMILNITASGEVQVYATSAITEDWIMRLCITFVGEYIL